MVFPPKVQRPKILQLQTHRVQYLLRMVLEVSTYFQRMVELVAKDIQETDGPGPLGKLALGYDRGLVCPVPQNTVGGDPKKVSEKKSLTLCLHQPNPESQNASLELSLTKGNCFTKKKTILYLYSL